MESDPPPRPPRLVGCAHIYNKATYFTPSLYIAMSNLVWITIWSYMLLQLFTNTIIFYQLSSTIFFCVHTNDTYSICVRHDTLSRMLQQDVTLNGNPH